MISSIFWDPNPELFVLPILNWPIRWYGVFFALGFMVGFPLFVRLLSQYMDRLKATALADKVTAYVVVGTVVGARLGHFFFYENPRQYLSDPFSIFRIWEGGLASHGALVGIFGAVILLSLRIKKFNWIRILDFVAIPTALAGCLIRVGNFFNQEILGTPTAMPWGIVFGHPADRSWPVARHPVQLYEAFFYLGVFFILWSLRAKLSQRGKLSGLFLMLIFGFRFCIEFLKTEQSILVTPDSWLTMGQILSVPVFLLGMGFFCLDLFYPAQDNELISEDPL
jgi:prolipoprotein diacylglyceryl transferase